MRKIKICGLRRPQDIDAANALLPDFVGFVFAPGRRRTITPDAAAALRMRLAPGIAPVGVFVDQPLQNVAELLHAKVIDIAQLQGSEDDDYIRALQQQTSRPVWKAYPLAGPGYLERALASPADCILLDNGPGGTGVQFDWGLLMPPLPRPWILAGGLSADNVAQAIARLQPWGVDVSSAVETDGYKDPEKMAAFVAAVKKEQ